MSTKKIVKIFYVRRLMREKNYNKFERLTGNRDHGKTNRRIPEENLLKYMQK